MTRSIAVFVLVCLVISGSGPALAQGPGSQHNHNWEANGFPTAAPMLASYYVRCGEVVAITGPPLGGDPDHCTVTTPACSFPNNQALNLVVEGSWSDGNAGGQFGHLDGSGNFVAGDPVTHYKAPDTPKVVSIRVTRNDDPPTATDPATGEEITTWDEPATPSDPAKLTVYEFEITNAGGGWLPVLDDIRTATATLAPGTDHLGNSLANNFHFSLTTSARAGYCSNATRTNHPNPEKNTDGNDLKIFDQAGFTVNAARTQADTNDPVLTASLEVYCLDCGPTGHLGASTSVGGVMVGARRADDHTKAGTGLPQDDDGSSISDAWTHDGPSDDDLDPTPTGANVGDGFPRFDEYRCFKVQGALERARPDIKHLFVYNPGGTHGYGRADIWGFETHGLNDDEQLGKVVNYYGANSMMTIRIIEDGTTIKQDDDGNLTLGESYEACPNHAWQRIYIYLAACTRGGADPDIVIAHEVGHDLNVRHNVQGEPSSIMDAWYPPTVGLNQKDRDMRCLHDCGK